MQELGLRGKNLDNLVKMTIKIKNLETMMYLKNLIQKMISQQNLLSLGLYFKKIDLQMQEHPINKEEVQNSMKMEIQMIPRLQVIAIQFHINLRKLSKYKLIIIFSYTEKLPDLIKNFQSPEQIRTKIRE